MKISQKILVSLLFTLFVSLMYMDAAKSDTSHYGGGGSATYPSQTGKTGKFLQSTGVSGSEMWSSVTLTYMDSCATFTELGSFCTDSIGGACAGNGATCVPTSGGAQGPAGTNGYTPDISIGTVTTGAPGSSADATITGTTPTLVLNISIPTGTAGDTGATGPIGPTGSGFSDKVDGVPGCLDFPNSNGTYTTTVCGSGLDSAASFTINFPATAPTVTGQTMVVTEMTPTGSKLEWGGNEISINMLVTAYTTTKHVSVAPNYVITSGGVRCSIASSGTFSLSYAAPNSTTWTDVSASPHLVISAATTTERQSTLTNWTTVIPAGQDLRVLSSGMSGTCTISVFGTKSR